MVLIFFSTIFSTIFDFEKRLQKPIQLRDIQNQLIYITYQGVTSDVTNHALRTKSRLIQVSENSTENPTYLVFTTTMFKSWSSSSVMFVLVCGTAGFHSQETFVGDDGVSDGCELTTFQLELFRFFVANVVSWLPLDKDVHVSPRGKPVSICSQRP